MTAPAQRAAPTRGAARFVGAGAVAGVLAVVAFTIVHQLLISPIWFAFPAMLAAGALCGTSLAWSYAAVDRAPTVRGWLRYNALYLAMLVALGATSLVAFEPVTTIGALLASREPPRALIGRALPVTALFTLGTAALLAALYRPGWRGAAGILASALLIVLFLGLNISILGLVALPTSAFGVLAEVALLQLVITATYTAAVVVLAPACLD